tara:strand:+ start:3695 stop:6661 length:2967 start_codon:yes stop_codon:yes gene_type:complete
MQNKGLLKLIALIFGLITIFLLSFTFKSNQIEDQADEYAFNKISVKKESGELKEDFYTAISDERIKYLDSLKEIQVYNLGISKYTYDDINKRSMNLGLDLKGGINAILQISVKDILKTLADNSENPIFNQALNDTDELQKNSQNSYLQDFYSAFDRIKGDTKLASYDIFANRSLSEEIPIGMSDNDVQSILNEKIEKSIESAVTVLRTRVDQFGVAQPNIQRLGETARISVELAGAKNPERVKNLLKNTAQLEFWYALNGQEYFSFLFQANEILKSRQSKSTPDQESELTEAEKLLGGENDSSIAIEKNPILDLIKPIGFGGPVIASFDPKDQDFIDQYLDDPEVKELLPDNVKVVWGKPTVIKNENDLDESVVQLYALDGNKNDIPPLSGSVVTDARKGQDNRGRNEVTMQMNAKGSQIWEEMTEKAFKSQNSQIAIVLDDVVYSAPNVNGVISGGSSSITGNFTDEEAFDLANVLNAGKLPASAELIQFDEVGPSLGNESIRTGTISFFIALLFVLFWMFFYYGRVGLYSNIALIFNMFLLFGLLAGLKAVLTLPGIAGIILTIGIAVDANVLIYERVREELYKGKKEKAAIADGYQNALSSILDANITTGLTAIILTFADGPVKGFAITLLLGIITSLFTAIFITRLFVNWELNRGTRLSFSTPITKGLFRNIKINFLNKRILTYSFSGIIILSGLISLLFGSKLDLGIDFEGGNTYTVRFANDVNPDEVKKSTDLEFGSSEVKTIGTPNQLKISTKYLPEVNNLDKDSIIQSKLYNSLKDFLPADYTYSKFITAENDIGKMMSSSVSESISDDIQKNSLYAVFGSLIVVFLYILFRFKKWQFSLGAVAAVFHDVLIVLGIFSLTYKFMPFSMEIDQAFIAAILTVIGYSLNDTVVVFDRIREFLKEHSTWDFDKTVNSALNSTLSRTLNTSFTTLVVLLAMFIFGADSLRGLLFALIVGVLVGTYSSVFIATPIMKDTLKKYRD